MYSSVFKTLFYESCKFIQQIQADQFHSLLISTVLSYILYFALLSARRVLMRHALRSAIPDETVGRAGGSGCVCAALAIRRHHTTHPIQPRDIAATNARSMNGALSKCISDLK